MYIFNTLGSCYCLLKQWSAYIINSSGCIINVWGYTELFPAQLGYGPKKSSRFSFNLRYAHKSVILVRVDLQYSLPNGQEHLAVESSTT